MFSEFCFTTLINLYPDFHKRLKINQQARKSHIAAVNPSEARLPRFSTLHFVLVLTSTNSCKRNDSIGGHHSDAILEF